MNNGLAKVVVLSSTKVSIKILQELLQPWLDQVLLRSFPHFALRSSSAHEGKIIIFERFQCFFTNII